MKYLLVYRKAGHFKWVTSSQYEFSAEHLIALIDAEPESFEWLLVPFILTLTASLEVNLNDWLMIDALNKHGPESYKSLAEANSATPLAKRLRLAVAVMTDNSFQLREDSSTVKTLDELMSCRNKITHPLAFFEVDEVAADASCVRLDKVNKHPLQSLTIKRCHQYLEAVGDLRASFFEPYDRGFVEENDLIKEIPRIGSTVSASPSE